MDVFHTDHQSLGGVPQRHAYLCTRSAEGENTSRTNVDVRPRRIHHEMAILVKTSVGKIHELTCRCIEKLGSLALPHTTKLIHYMTTTITHVEREYQLMAQAKNEGPGTGPSKT
jgi:hypothetical protein